MAKCMLCQVECSGLRCDACNEKCNSPANKRKWARRENVWATERAIERGMERRRYSRYGS